MVRVRNKLFKIQLTIVVISALTMALTNNSFSQSIQIKIDLKHISNEDTINGYFNIGDIKFDNKYAFYAEREDYIVAQIQSNECKLEEKCITLVVLKCDDKVCPYVFTLAGNNFISSDTFNEVFGLRSSIFFHNGVGLSINRHSIIVVSLPK